MTALVTGGRGGIGSAICALLDDPLPLDLPEFDVGEPDAWRSIEGEFDAAFLNAGIGIGYPDAAELPESEYRRIVGANLDGVVFGTRELARRLMPTGGSIVATASLAGLTAMPFDPAYTATKHAVVGWVRAAAPRARGARDPDQRALPGIHRHADRHGTSCATTRSHRSWSRRSSPRRRCGSPRTRRRGAHGSCSRTASSRSASRGAGATMSPRSRKPWGENPPPDPHVWNTLRYRGIEQADGRAVIEWDATPEYCFHSPSGPIVHGGMVAALLDTAMGGACWTLMSEDEDFLTADLRTEFHRSARPGTLRAEGHVVQRNRRVVFCAAELFQDGELVASARCTQIVRRTD